MKRKSALRTLGLVLLIVAAVGLRMYKKYQKAEVRDNNHRQNMEAAAKVAKDYENQLREEAKQQEQHRLDSINKVREDEMQAKLDRLHQTQESLKKEIEAKKDSSK